MSKKIIALCLALVMVLSMAACSAPAQTTESDQTAEPAAETPVAEASTGNCSGNTHSRFSPRYRLYYQV